MGAVHGTGDGRPSLTTSVRSVSFSTEHQVPLKHLYFTPVRHRTKSNETTTAAALTRTGAEIPKQNVNIKKLPAPAAFETFILCLLDTEPSTVSISRGHP